MRYHASRRIPSNSSIDAVRGLTRVIRTDRHARRSPVADRQASRIDPGLDLTNGRWLKPLPPTAAKGEILKPGGTISVLASDGHVAVLNALVKRDRDGLVSVGEYEVSCYLAEADKPIWSKSLAHVGEPWRPDEDPASPIRPWFSDSNLQHLSWLDDTLIVCADSAQPILNLNRDTGTLLWQLNRPWEFQRQAFLGFEGYKIVRFGPDSSSEDLKATATERLRVDKQSDCWIVGGPIVVPLHAERGHDTHSIFVAISKSDRARDLSRSTPDCVLYEFNQGGKPVALLNLPQTVRGERFKRVKDGVVWNCQNNMMIKVACTGQSSALGTGQGGADRLLMMPWLRQLASLSFGRWADSDAQYEPVAYSDEFAFCVSESGYIATGDRSIYHFPLVAIDLRTGAGRSLTLHVPVEIKAPESEENKRTPPSSRIARAQVRSRRRNRRFARRSTGSLDEPGHAYFEPDHRQDADLHDLH